jgi:tagatose 6-phosphate kinase
VILTVAPDAALDLLYRLPAPSPRLLGRHSGAAADEPGGARGPHVARVLAALGHPVTVTGFAGGAAAAEVRGLLAGRAVDALVPVAPYGGRTYGSAFHEPGPSVAPGEWAALLAGYRSLLARGVRAVALCGSLPRGVPVGGYAELIRAARAAGVHVLLDTWGPALRRGLAARPDVVRAGAADLADLTGFADTARAARDVRRRGARAVVAAPGPAEGALLLAGGSGWRATAPVRPADGPAAAGSAVAGLLSGAAEGLPWPRRLARAVALAAATPPAEAPSAAGGEEPGGPPFDAAAYAELLPRVEVAPVEPDVRG